MNNASPKESIQVAVVEDKVAFRRGIQAILEMTPGIDCVGIYPTAESALEKIPGSSAQVVLMDVNLPGQSGIECAHVLKQSMPELQIIMLTIEEDSERVFAALRAGASGYLLKTATPAQIVEAIALVAQGGSPMSATIARRVVESFHGVPERGAARQSLSPREIDVLEKIANGRRIKEAASDLNVSVTTVQSYLRRIFEKLQVNSQAEAVAKFLR
ncbi:MAG TPA: response regulator transcription factor [Verrucomicrobiae bacterium]|jgi:DNA-binding NarL/FixJ family response regulator|nr:response regulator transcription factor [Verrucomicrobiae bacterium]